MRTSSWALAVVSCSHVIKCAAWSPGQCIYTLSSAETGIPIRVCLHHSPYGASSLVFCCPSAWEVHQTLESNLSTADFYSTVTFLSLANRISHTWLHRTEEEQQPQADVARPSAYGVENWVSRTVSWLLLNSSLCLERRDVGLRLLT